MILFLRGGEGGANKVYYFERCTNDESCVKDFVPDFLVCFLINV